jgi:low affinity Fe/Cu permease
MEKETAEAVGRAVADNPGLIGGGIAFIAAIFGWLLRMLYRAIGHRITAASQAASSAAATALAVEERRRNDIKDVHEKLDGHIARDIDMHEQVLGAMHAQTSKLGDIHAAIEKALGERPTRDEVNRLIELHQSQRA